MATKKYASITAITELWAKAKATFVKGHAEYGNVDVAISTVADSSAISASLSVVDGNTMGYSVLDISQSGVFVESSDDISINGSGGVSISGSGGVYITDLASPTSSSQAASKGYVDSSIPTAVSSLTNDAGYLTLATLPIYNGSYSQVNS